MRQHNPKTVAPPLSRYSHAVEVPAGVRMLHVSGQVGVRPDGTLARGAEAQLEQAWRNLLAILEEAGMGVEHIVKVTAFLTPGVEMRAYRTVRDRILGGAAPASTLVAVAGLASDDYLCEIEAIAGRPD
jgi:enamine deaminase RidA (YjgF/YER057c/UK114 family)